MTGNEYQTLAMRTCNVIGKDMLYHGVFGLTSEAGEVAGIIQKVYQGHDFDKEHMKKELGDCMWMSESDKVVAWMQLPEPYKGDTE